jgi:ribosomal protein L11 methyltransferase
MNWNEVNVSVDRAQVLLVQTALESLDALAVTLCDDADQPVLEPPAGSTPLWPRVEVRGLFDDQIDRGEVEEKLHAVTSNHTVFWREVADQDWERAWIDRFQPMQFGEHLWIVPGGMESPADPAAVVVQLDPGLAFGTGTHPTTDLCLQWIDRCNLHGRLVVDYGCGSGILGIAAALKGARQVVCVDHDTQALEATTINAGRNGVSAQILCLSPADYSTETGINESADVVLANILALPLIELAPVLTNALKPGGELVLSGLLESQQPDLNEAYRSAFGELNATILDGWLRLDGRKLLSGPAGRNTDDRE